MTYKKFLETLKKTNRNWILSASGAMIVRLDTLRCPITTVCSIVCGDIFDNSQYLYAARRLKLRRNLAENIVIAADNRMHTRHQARIRRDLLRATGL